MKIATLNSLVLALVLVLGASHAAAAEDAPATLEMRLVVECAPGAVPLPFDHQGLREKLCLAKELILDRSDIVDAQEIQSAYGEDVVRISINAKAVSRLTDATTTHVGERFAFVFDGKVVFAPVVREPITGNELEISMGLGFSDLAAVVQALRNDVSP